MISVVSGLALQVPTVSKILMPSEQPGMLMHVFAAMAVFLGVMLIICTRDLSRRGTLVAWEGVLRLFGCALMVGFGLFSSAGTLAVFTGIFDGAVGVAYLYFLPRHLGVSLSGLLLDHNAQP